MASSKNSILTFVALIVLLVTVSAWSQHQPMRARVYVVKIEGTIDLGLAPFVKRVLVQAQQKRARLVVLDMDTLGGRLDAGVAIRDALIETPQQTVAFVRRRAISAGALIAMAADKIAMAEGATIGAATPVQLQPGGPSTSADEKTVSYVRKEFKATAERRGRPAQLAEAMVDPSVEIEGVVEKGKLLTLTAKEGVERGLVDYAANDLDALLRQMNIEDAEVTVMSPLWAERTVRFVTDPALASILMSLGLLGLLVEIRTPGFGVPGLVGLGCLALFFWGHFIAKLAGAEEIALIVAGIVLLGLELFVIPGFGIAGVLGLLGLSAGLALSMVGAGVNSVAVIAAATRTLLSLGAAILGLALLMRFAPRLPFANRMVLTATLGRQVREDPHAVRPSLAGQHGVTLSPLRPAGVALMGGARIDVVSEGTFIEAGEHVEVVREEGHRVVVRRLDA